MHIFSEWLITEEENQFDISFWKGRNMYYDCPIACKILGVQSLIYSGVEKHYYRGKYAILRAPEH